MVLAVTGTGTMIVGTDLIIGGAVAGAVGAGLETWGNARNRDAEKAKVAIPAPPDSGPKPEEPKPEEPKPDEPKPEEPKPDEPKPKGETGLYPDPFGDGGGNPAALPAYDGSGGGNPVALPAYEGSGGGNPVALADSSKTIWGTARLGAMWDDQDGGHGPTPTTVGVRVTVPMFIGPGLLSSVSQISDRTLVY
ncbi:hypothetical protein [Leifsonia shinshuensis]|uniref:Uncharacterized protein n=1 Tax=Leifsonia shinshuensis TaxID=150026 RepID=A0A853CR82_9MICO|nr:hypothetical protein [Leifsonia shinshuensis]NYJ21714.1 hypothetical protein [Leifsonia shinshuensis]